MASTSYCQINLTFSPVTPHFYKMVLQDSLFDNKLQIPIKFMMKYGTNINTSNLVLLKVPSGEEWKVKLTKYDGHVWLGEGWPEFARHHSIKCGHSLFFRYEGQSKFHVVIVDENGLEINYPVVGSSHFYDSNTNIDELPKREEEAQEDDDYDSDENFRGCSPCLKRKEKSLPPFSWRKRRMETQSKLGGRFKSRAKECGGEGEPQFFREKEKLLTADEKAEALLSRTKDFTSPNPYFKVFIRKSHVQDCYDLALPLEFWREHLNEKFGRDATLYVPHGRTWLVKLHTRTIYGHNLPSLKGWQDFTLDNNLKVGDVCIFELINKNEMLFKVSIDREAEYVHNGQQFQGNMPPTDQTSENEFQHCLGQGKTNVKPSNMNFRSKPKEHTSEFTHDVPSSSRGGRAFEGAARQSNPSFKVELRESFCHIQRMPTGFGRTYFGEKPQVVTLQVGNKLWPVKLVSGSGGMFFSGGWPAFARENRLHPGDSCVFELVGKNRDETLLKVTISQPTVI